MTLLLTSTTTSSTPLSHYHSLEPSPALATSTLSSASSSNVSLVAEDEGKHGSLYNWFPLLGLEAPRVFGNLRETICHASRYRECHDHREQCSTPKAQGKTEESGVSVHQACLANSMPWWSVLKKALSFRDIRLLAISTHVTELSYAISDIQTRIFGLSCCCGVDSR